MDRAKMFCRQGAGGRGYQALVGQGWRQLIGPIGDADTFQEEPGTFNVAVSYSTSPAWVGLLLMAARVSWGTGTGTHTAEVDVPARGTIFTVTGADGLQVDVQATGASNDIAIMAQATVAMTRSGPAIPAQRTHRGETEQGQWLGPIVRIPAFAREARVMSEIAVPAAMAGAYLRYWVDLPGTGGVYAVVDCSDDRPHPIPQGAEYYDILPLNAMHQHFSIIWELRL